ncbi:putative gamma-glutamyltransferase YwrD [Grifola frondosa]|uniref:Putative gamma-glutamyltransferase YwrD n=1 Tax=Grifola frondosa TaxID=5627 RepID=A0A1C7MT17_GRIFR|nr:putative gamma-glutamyltransferase YwrD [Grifola frondosa]
MQTLPPTTTAKMKIDWSKVDQPEIVFQRFPSRRSQVYGTKGIVASSQPLATEAGLEILRKGGNAADAAVATSAALNVTEPSCCGIGGDAFCLFYDAKTKTVKALNGSGHSPAKLTIDHVRQQGAPATTSPSPTSTPGTLTIADVLAPAIRLAEEGVPVSEIHSYSYQRSESLLKSASPNGDEMLLNGRAPLPGQIITLTNLGKTLRAVAENGKDGFYKGRVAEAIVELIQSRGGVMELEDLAKHETTFVEPIKYTFNGEVTVYECPPNGQGITALLALGILDHIQEQGKIGSLLEMEHNSAEYLHVLIEALRLAFADSQYYVTDPDMAHIPIAELLSKEYLASRARLFDPTKTNPEVIHGNPVNSSDTVYFSVSDQWGNACSFIQSNYAGFGTGAVPKGCGFTLQNRGSNFNLTPGHPNALQGGKRPYHTIIPDGAARDALFLSYGVMGGFMQPQGHVQVLLNVLRAHTAQAALDAPRFCISAGSPDSQSARTGAPGDVNSEVYIEEGIPDAVLDALRAIGPRRAPREGMQRGMLGRGQIIQRLVDPSGRTVWAAGSDPRADGHAAPQI